MKRKLEDERKIIENDKVIQEVERENGKNMIGLESKFTETVVEKDKIRNNFVKMLCVCISQKKIFKKAGKINY